ncbi:MAG: hypothetical protein N3E49_00540 [Bacteroidia bacterium]|nr:hypothetical protein [Bacteroidia bacterium]
MGSNGKYRWIRSPYVWVTLAAVLWIGILDTHSWWQQRRLATRLRQMQEQYDFYEEQIRTLKSEEKALLHDPYTQEYHARSHYWVKKPNERLFLIRNKKQSRMR